MSGYSRNKTTCRVNLSILFIAADASKSLPLSSGKFKVDGQLVLLGGSLGAVSVGNASLLPTLRSSNLIGAVGWARIFAPTLTGCAFPPSSTSAKPGFRIEDCRNEWEGTFQTVSQATLLLIPYIFLRVQTPSLHGTPGVKSKLRQRFA